MAPYNILTYVGVDGPRAGLCCGNRVFDIERLTGVAQDATVLGVLSDWENSESRLKTAAELAQAGGGGESWDFPTIALAPAIMFPSAIYCVGANYTDHLEEMARASGQERTPNAKEAGLRSWHFLKPTRTLVPHRCEVNLPRQSHAVDWEVELAAVIGRPARNVTVEKALHHVAGYMVAIDLSARDLFPRPPILKTSPFYFDWLGHKGFDGACPAGPWITPSALVGDPQVLSLGLSVNGVVKQQSNTGQMIFNVAEQISDLSQLRTLYPGDLVLTGTPAGVGAPRREFLKPGDMVEAWVEKIGSLRVLIAEPL